MRPFSKNRKTLDEGSATVDQQPSDAAVKQTNDDATAAKLSAVCAGYYEDWALEALCRDHSGSPALAKRPPLINRGTFARVLALRSSLYELLDLLQQPPQLLSLGAGFDSLFWNLEGYEFDKLVEVDHHSVAGRKAEIISADERLSCPIGSSKKGPFNDGNVHCYLTAAKYVLVGADLRSSSELVSSMTSKGVLTTTKPLVILTEVVLVYMDPKESDSILKLLCSTFPNVALLNFEMIRPEDDFGRQMVRNIRARGCPLLGVHRHPTPTAQEERCFSCGLQEAYAHPMDEVYAKLLSDEDRRRAARCEMLDELEEWNLLMAHYVLVMAASGSFTERLRQCVWQGMSLRWWSNLRRRPAP